MGGKVGVDYVPWKSCREGSAMGRYQCPRCHSVLEPPDHKAGSKINCPKCRQRLQVPLPPPTTTILAPLVQPAEPPHPEAIPLDLAPPVATPAEPVSPMTPGRPRVAL